MLLLLALVLPIAAVFMGWKLWSRLEDREDAAFLGWFCLWMGKGVIVPLAGWQVLHWLWVGRPLAQARAAFQAALAGGGVPPGGRWPQAGEFAVSPGVWPGSAAGALWFILAVWAAVNFLWLLGRAWPRSQPGTGQWMTGVLLGLLLLPVALIIACGLGLAGIFWGLAFWFGTMAYVFIHQSARPLAAVEPSYGGAEGLLKFGRFDQAEQAIIAQLERTEDDYTGWLMLAELYALHFRDLPTADRTVHDLCAQKNVNASQVGAALHKLADWYLAVDENPVAARSVLEEIELLYPNTHLAFMARQRIRRLPASRADLQAGKQAPTIRLRPGATAPPGGFAPMTSCEGGFAEERAGQLARQLEAGPADHAAREELARLLEGPLHRAGEGMEHLRQLIASRLASAEQRGAWLNLLATWELRHRRDGTEGRRTLDRIVREHAGTAAADQAAKRLQMLAIEDRFRPTAPRKPGPIRVEVTKPRRPAEADALPPPKWD